MSPMRHLAGQIHHFFPELAQACVCVCVFLSLTRLYTCGRAVWAATCQPHHPVRRTVRPERLFLKAPPSSFIIQFSRQIQDSPSPWAPPGTWLCSSWSGLLCPHLLMSRPHCAAQLEQEESLCPWPGPIIKPQVQSQMDACGSRCSCPPG